MNFGDFTSIIIVFLLFTFRLDRTLTLVEPTTPQEHPFNIVVEGKYTCTGVLLSDEYAICPAHCVNGSTWGVKLYLGFFADAYFQPDIWQVDTEVVEYPEIIIHENFEGISKHVYINNIALLKFPRKVYLRENIQPRPLISKHEYQLIGETVVNITGWFADTVGDLSITSIQLLNQDTCSHLYGPNIFKNQQVCVKWDAMEENRLNLAGNPVSINEKVLGFLTISPCLLEDSSCTDHDLILTLPPFLDWLSRKTNIGIDTLTGMDKGTSKTEKKIDSLTLLVNDINTQNNENFAILRQLEDKINQLADVLKGIKKGVEDSCIVWNEYGAAAAPNEEWY